MKKVVLIVVIIFIFYGCNTNHDDKRILLVENMVKLDKSKIINLFDTVRRC